MTPIERDVERFVIDAGLLADAFGLSEDAERRKMRAGEITSRGEVGVAEDAGRWRLSFHHGGRTCRVVVDADGRIVKRVGFGPARGAPSASAVDLAAQ